MAHPTTNFTGVHVNAGLLPAPMATPADTSTAVVPAGALSAHSASALVGVFTPIVENRYPLQQCKGMDCFDPSFYNKIMTKAFAAAIKPQNHNQAINSPDAAFWLAAEKEEINNLLSNKTWDLVELPPNRKAISMCWVYKIKLNDIGQHEKFKARLVAKGYTQKQGLNFQETFAPVAKITSIRAILAVAAHNNWQIHQLDVTAAYLNDVIDAEIFMAQPPGYVDPAHPNMVCRLRTLWP